jgi:hypothetical protein
MCVDKEYAWNALPENPCRAETCRNSMPLYRQLLSSEGELVGLATVLAYTHTHTPTLRK